jgi:hypothetical protein
MCLWGLVELTYPHAPFKLNIDLRHMRSELLKAGVLAKVGRCNLTSDYRRCLDLRSHHTTSTWLRISTGSDHSGIVGIYGKWGGIHTLKSALET